ncbi:spermine/spermidine synthase domain-containing protein [Methylocaldum szegediense]|uniref:Spermine/spermidine synthase n=1 Tax=Methylocaldum szegediense TaxID=73780 RepID=A0ABM9I5F6_9GAMM|nr:spermidine synthase [Methylocaldum szegediense]CAI8904415.1 Spermine/spermidine synthase [Methylocaldum szegediense]
MGDSSFESGCNTEGTLHISPPRLLLLAVSFISAAALAYEILLMRLFSIIQWHHFAYMMISLALLGYGASGTFLTLARGFLLRHFASAFVLNAALFGLSSTACFLFAQTVPFNALELLWDPGEWGHLVLIYVILTPPFFFAANCIGLTYQRYREAIGRTYAADLSGAGVGALAVVLLLFWVFPLDALVIASGVGLAAASLAWVALAMRPRALVVLLAIATAVPWLFVGRSGAELRPVEYKNLSQTLRISGAVQIEERSSPLGLLSVVRSPEVPFRHVPGLSLNSPVPVPEQLGVFTDGDGMSAINRWDGSRDSLGFLDYVPSALPYHLLPPKPKVLVLGAGGGSEVLQAIYHDAEHIDAVELNPDMIDLVSRDFADFAGHVYSHPSVTVHAEEARSFVAASRKRYDLIQIALLDAFTTSSAGSYALNESYLYTIEALQAYLAHLRPGGFLAVTRWVRLPPRDEVKLFATAVEAVTRSSRGAPEQRLIWIRGWQTSTLLVKNGAVSDSEIAALRQFCDERSFDLAYYPGIEAREANLRNRLKEPYFFEAATVLLNPERDAFIRRYKFEIRPATDDRPYFFQFFKWPLLWEAVRLKGSGGLSLLDMGYPILIATLVQSAVISVLLILAPLRILLPRSGGGAGKSLQYQVFAYFFAIGLAFMFTEIVYIQKFILYLGHPLYAVAVVLAGFLVFAGMGSRYAARIAPHQAGRHIFRAAKMIIAVSAVYALIFPFLFDSSIALYAPVKVAVVLALIAPLAFFMGMPFPLGLARLASEAETLVPWAFGINGCASVVAAILATVLAIHVGQLWLLMGALSLYGVAGFTAAHRHRNGCAVP